MCAALTPPCGEDAEEQFNVEAVNTAEFYFISRFFFPLHIYYDPYHLESNLNLNSTNKNKQNEVTFSCETSPAAAAAAAMTFRRAEDRKHGQKHTNVN